MRHEVQPCPLCGADGASLFHEDKRRCYLRCPQCTLVYVPAVYHLAPDREKARYDLHRNDPADPAYRAFLRRLMDPLVARLPPGAYGLDYGSGPGPTLSRMLEERGYPTAIYDAFYAPDTSVLARHYDFLACSETMEHFARPGREWHRFLALVRPGGWIGIMTQFLEMDVDFSSWYYKNDDTHVAFYSRATFRFLARRDGLTVDFEGNSVALFRR